MKEHQRPLTLAGLSHLIKQLKSGLNLKQDTLTAGDNIKITSDTISATVNIDAMEDLRKVDGKLEFYDGTEWKKITGEGYPVGNVTNFQAVGDDTTVALTWTDPPNVTVDDSLGNLIVISTWKSTKILRKLKSQGYPQHENDGVLVVDSGVRDQYKTTPFIDTGLINDQDYYYMAFPQTEEGVFTVDEVNRVIGTPSEIDPTTWSSVQKIVRKGLTNDFFTVGDQLMALYDGVETVFEVIGIDVDTPSDPQYTHSMTLQTKDCLYNRAFDPDDDNRYINSPIRTHLNGEFLNKLDPELSAVLGKVDKKVAKRDDLGGGQDSFSDKVFLLSRVEVDLGTEGDTTGEKVYPFYDGLANAARIKNLDGSPSHWWLRSPYVDYSYTVRYVATDGSINFSHARSTRGVSPACVII